MKTELLPLNPKEGLLQKSLMRKVKGDDAAIEIFLVDKIEDCNSGKIDLPIGLEK